MFKFILWVALVMGDGEVRFGTDVYYGLEDCIQAIVEQQHRAFAFNYIIQAWCVKELHA